RGPRSPGAAGGGDRRGARDRGRRGPRPEPAVRVHPSHRKGAERVMSANGTERPGEAGASGASLSERPEGTGAKRRTRAPAMIGTLLRISWTNLKRDRVAQALTFLLPIMFFSIFATVFGNPGSTTTARIRVAVVDEDQSDFSRRIVEGLEKETALRVRKTVDAEGKGALLDRDGAQTLVKSGDVPVAVVLPKGLGSSAAAF